MNIRAYITIFDSIDVPGGLESVLTFGNQHLFMERQHIKAIHRRDMLEAHIAYPNVRIGHMLQSYLATYELSIITRRKFLSTSDTRTVSGFVLAFSHCHALGHIYGLRLR